MLINELKKYFGNDKYKLTPLGRKFLRDNIEELEEILSENGEKKKEKPMEEIAEEPIKEIKIEEEVNKNIKKEERIENVEAKVVEHKDKFAKNYIVTGVIIILAVVCINIFL